MSSFGLGARLFIILGRVAKSGGGPPLYRLRGQPPQRRQPEHRTGYQHQENILRSGGFDQPGKQRDRNDRDREADAIGDRQRRADQPQRRKRALSVENCGESPATTTPQNNRKARNTGKGARKISGETTQHRPDADNCI